MSKPVKLKLVEKKELAPAPFDEERFNQTLGARLKAIRKSLAISQEYLGGYLNIHQTAVCRIENGEQTVTPQQLDLLSRLYKVKIDDMINDKISLSSIQKKASLTKRKLK